MKPQMLFVKTIELYELFALKLPVTLNASLNLATPFEM